MRLIEDNLSDEFDLDGSIKFEMNGYVYYIGEFDGTDGGWFSRQTKEDYYNHKDNWESPEWVPENKPSFKLGR